MGEEVSDDDIDVLARTIYGEARGEGEEGMKAVASVVMNRVALADRHKHFGDGSVASACKAHMQFDCWMASDPNLHKIEAVTQDDPVFAAAVQIATDAVNGDLDDNTGGATYYYARGIPTPAWAVGKTPCATIGHHFFFKDIS